MKKLLILGSDFGTISVVKEAHRQGMYVIVADLMETSPTKKDADEAWMISTTDIDELERRSREAGITAVMFGASDFNISNCRKLCQRLGLPIYCDDDHVWDVVRDKRAFKTLCAEVGAPIATDYQLTDDNYKTEADRLSYPVVVKPSDKSGNRGMNFCADKEAFIKGYEQARAISDRSIIVERQLCGEEFNVHYALADGEASLLYFTSTHHEPGQASNLYSFKCTTSNHLRQYIDEVNDSVIQVIKRAGCKEGIAWVDIMRDADGSFYLLEMGYRFGGVMTYVPYAQVSGFNTVRWMLDIACGKKHTKADLPEPLNQVYTSMAASYHLFTKRAGVVKEMTGLGEISKMDGVFIDIPKRKGTTVREKAGMGLLGIYGKDVDDMCQKITTINSLLNVTDETDESLIIKFDDIKAIRREYQDGLKDFNAGV